MCTERARRKLPFDGNPIGRAMQLCVVVRTYAAEQRASLAALLASLIAAGEKGATGCGLRISVDVLPTDANQSVADAT